MSNLKVAFFICVHEILNHHNWKENKLIVTLNSEDFIPVYLWNIQFFQLFEMLIFEKCIFSK